MADIKRYWVHGDGQGYIGTVIRNGIHLITVEETRSKVKVMREGKTSRHILRRQWDALPKVLCRGQPFPEALEELSNLTPKKRKKT